MRTGLPGTPDPGRVWHGSSGLLRRAPFGNRHGGVSLPVLLVRGGLSDLLPEAGAQHFLGLCPHSEYVNISGVGHVVAGDRNDVFGLYSWAPAANSGTLANTPLRIR